MKLSLRHHFTAGALLLALLALGTAASLVVITSWMERESLRLWQALESVRAAEELERALLVHQRERQLLEATKEERHAHALEEAERETRRWLEEVRRHVSGAQERALVEGNARELEAYLRATHAWRATMRESAAPPPSFGDRSLALSRRLVEQNLADARATLQATQRWNRLANGLGFFLSLALVAGVGLILWSTRRYVYHPLRALREALVQFQLGGARPPLAPEGVRELREMARAFDAMATRLEDQREGQLRFIAGVAHDLRNPLNALLTMTYTVRPDRPLPPEQRLREHFHLVARQVGRLSRMVEDLLDTSRIEAGQLALSWGEHDVVELAREAVDLHRSASEAHQWVTHWPEGPVRVRCDGQRLSQVLNNLLSNALKYSPVGGPVRVEVEPRAGGVSIAVTDRGIGIPATEHESIFEPFRRSRQTSTTFPDVGLGLSVARRIVEAHGGRIEVESETGVGSTFRIWLPPHPPGEGRAASSGGPQQPSTPALP